MKHKRKCIEKRMYLMRNSAEDVVTKLYIRKGKLYSVYECSMCLAFHLTSDASTTTYQQKRRLTRLALKAWFPHWNRQHINELINVREAHFRRHYGLSVIGNKIGIKGVMKPVSLTSKEQQEAYKLLNN